MAIGVIMVVVVLAVEELRVEGEDALEVEGAAVEHLVERDGAALGAVDDRLRVDRPDAPLDRRQFVLGFGVVEPEKLPAQPVVVGVYEIDDVSHVAGINRKRADQTGWIGGSVLID